MTTYKQAGVDIGLGDICSRIMSEASDRTFKNRRKGAGTVKILEKKGLHRVITVSFGNFLLMLNSDGIGTKVEFSERMNRYDTMAYDLLAMLCDDSVRYGAEPVAVSNILDVSSLDGQVVKQLAKGMVKAARTAGVAVISGEIAELGKRVSGYGAINYNWGGTVLSVMKKEISGEDIKSGDVIVGFREKGFRSNGISLVRKIMEKEYGSGWHKKTDAGKNLGEMALEPSTIYSRAVIEALDRVKGVAHVTGGGIPGKLGRVTAATGLGADISDPFEPCRMMLMCQEKGKVSDTEAYRTWNMGQGMLVVTDKPEKVIAAAGAYRIKAKITGVITKEKKLKIRSRGFFSRGSTLTF